MLEEDTGSGVSTKNADWNEGVSDDQAKDLNRGYLASTSYSDAQAGRILVALKKEGMEESTIVIIWGDHGYHLTDHGLWRKNTIYHVANRIPLLMRVPEMVRGKVSDAIVESLDIYPTILELAGIQRSDLRLHGRSLVPLLDNPKAEWPYPAFISGGTYYGIVTEQHRFSLSDKHPTKLFDLKADPSEWRNLAPASEYRELVTELTRQVKQAWHPR